MLSAQDNGAAWWRSAITWREAIDRRQWTVAMSKWWYLDDHVQGEGGWWTLKKTSHHHTHTLTKPPPPVQMFSSQSPVQRTIQHTHTHLPRRYNKLPETRPHRKYNLGVSDLLLASSVIFARLSDLCVLCWHSSMLPQGRHTLACVLCLFACLLLSLPSLSSSLSPLRTI